MADTVSNQPVRVDHPQPGVVHVVLADPERRNPINHAVLDALEGALFGDAAAVVLSAVPGPAFSAGGDLSLGEDQLQRVSDRIYDLWQPLSETATVLIVAADGQAVGGGAHLLLAADLRIAGPALRFRPALPDRGLAAGMWLLPAVVGRGRALDLMLTGRALDAQEAVEWGVADRLAQDATQAALELAAGLVNVSARHRARVKRSVAKAVSWQTLADERESFRPPTGRTAKAAK